MRGEPASIRIGAQMTTDASEGDSSVETRNVGHADTTASSPVHKGLTLAMQ